MMNLIKLFTCLVVGIVFLSSCGDNSIVSNGNLDFGEVNPGQKIEKNLTIDFNAAAKSDKSAFLEFEFCDSLGSPISEITFIVGQRKFQGQKFRITPTDLDPNNKVRIGIQFSANATEKDYAGYLMLVNASDELKQNISNPDTKKNINVLEKIGTFKATYRVPMPTWLFWSVILLSITIVAFIIFFILTRNNMPFGKKTFTYGTIGFPNLESPTVYLDKLGSFDISKVLNLEPGLILEPYDKLIPGGKKRMARLRNSSNMEVKIVVDNTEQMIGVMEDLYNMDEVKIIFGGQVYLLNYINNKIVRSFF